MKKELLLSSDSKYLYIEVPPEIALTGGENFERLLEYIGNAKDHGRTHYFGNAHIEIRKKTNAKLGVQGFKISKLKVSKSEVRALRQCFKKHLVNNKTYIMKIPYKASYLFESICDIIDEIKETKPIPQHLNPLVGLTYEIAFYSRYINAYMDKHPALVADNDGSPTSICKVELFSDFRSLASPFQKKFR